MLPMRTIGGCLHPGGIVLALGGDALMLSGTALRSRVALAAENLFLRKQLVWYRERQGTP